MNIEQQKERLQQLVSRDSIYLTITDYYSIHAFSILYKHQHESHTVHFEFFGDGTINVKGRITNKLLSIIEYSRNNLMEEMN